MLPPPPVRPSSPYRTTLCPFTEDVKEGKAGRTQRAEPSHERGRWRKAMAFSRLAVEAMQRERANSLLHLASDCGLEGKVLVQADAWDRRHRQHVSRAHAAFDALHSTAPRRAGRNLVRTEAEFKSAVVAVTTNRIALTPRARRVEVSGDDHMPPLPALNRRAARQSYSNIWAPRAEWCDAQGLFDTEPVQLAAFGKDWERALQLGIHELIVKYDDDAEADLDGDGCSDEVAEVSEVLWTHYGLIVQLFTYYACCGGSVESVRLNEWKLFVEEAGLLSKRRFQGTREWPGCGERVESGWSGRGKGVQTACLGTCGCS